MVLTALLSEIHMVALGFISRTTVPGNRFVLEGVVTYRLNVERNLLNSSYCTVQCDFRGLDGVMVTSIFCGSR